LTICFRLDDKWWICSDIYWLILVLIFLHTFLKNQSYAIKTVSPQGTDISSCLDRGHRYDVCYNEAAKKIIKETSLLQRLIHPNIIKVCKNIRTKISQYISSG
jgi:serine/threonine protein kinase